MFRAFKWFFLCLLMITVGWLLLQEKDDFEPVAEVETFPVVKKSHSKPSQNKIDESQEMQPPDTAPDSKSDKNEKGISSDNSAQTADQKDAGVNSETSNHDKVNELPKIGTVGDAGAVKAEKEKKVISSGEAKKELAESMQNGGQKVDGTTQKVEKVVLQIDDRVEDTESDNSKLVTASIRQSEGQVSGEDGSSEDVISVDKIEGESGELPASKETPNDPMVDQKSEPDVTTPVDRASQNNAERSVDLSIRVPDKAGTEPLIAETLEEYTIVSGDTLEKIARKNGLELISIFKANPQLEEPYNIFPGQKIKLPSN